MARRFRRWSYRLPPRLGGVASGTAAAAMTYAWMSVSVSTGIPPNWLFVATAAFGMTYVFAGSVAPPNWRIWARTASLVATGISALSSFAGWEGHGGGYWEASSMRGYVVWVSEDVPTPDPEPEELRSAVAAFHDETRDYFRSGVETSQTETGWTFAVTHPESGRVCAVFRGPEPVWPSVTEGRARCGLPVPWGYLALLSGILAAGVLLTTLGTAPDEAHKQPDKKRRTGAT